MALNQKPTLLLCDDDTAFHLSARQTLRTEFELRSAYNGDEALAILRNHRIDVVLLDVQMRTPSEGIALIPRILELDGEMPIIMLSGLTDLTTVKEAMKLGAIDYLPKDCPPDALLLALKQALDRKRLVQKNSQAQFEVATSHRQYAMIGESPCIQRLKAQIEKLRRSSAHVLIFGETGTGKEVVARQLRGQAADGAWLPFIAVDSSTIQSTTAESHLFGHEKGAFTGAEKAAKGVFEEANGGVIYFDELANMPLGIQAKLLRVIQEKEVVRMGASKPISLEFRVVSATNRDLEAMVRNGEFKEDLLQRLNVLPVELPPLRDRTEDIPLLVQHFCRLQSKGRDITFDEESIQRLMEYRWPGNIRELSNVIAYVLTLTDSDTIGVADLPPRVRELRPPSSEKRTDGSASAESQSASFYDRVAEFEKQVLAEEYRRIGGNISKLAIHLGMDRSHLHTKLKEYGIHPSSGPSGSGKSR